MVDVGAAPGGWSQYAVERVGITIPHSVFSIDLLDIEPITGVHFLCGDFMSESARNKLEDYIDNRKVDVVISDIAPNFSGDHSIDHEKQIDMCESVIEFAKRVAKKDCSVVLKVLQGEEFPSFMESVRSQFRSVNLIKPKASRKKSTEIYCVLKHFLLLVCFDQILEFQKENYYLHFLHTHCKMARFLLISFFLLSVALSEFIYEYIPCVCLILQWTESADRSYVKADVGRENVSSRLLVHE